MEGRAGEAPAASETTDPDPNPNPNPTLQINASSTPSASLKVVPLFWAWFTSGLGLVWIFVARLTFWIYLWLDLREIDVIIRA